MWSQQKQNARKVRYVRQQVQHRAYREPERGGDLEGAHRVADIVHDVVHARPARICVQDFERGSGILRASRERLRARSAGRRG